MPPQDEDLTNVLGSSKNELADVVFTSCLDTGLHQPVSDKVCSPDGINCSTSEPAFGWSV